MLWFQQKSNLVKYLNTKQQCKSNVQSVKSLVALERLACIDMEAQVIEEQFKKNDIIGMHKSIVKITRLAGKQTSHKITRVFNDAGVLSESFEEERYAFREYFCKLMNGTESSFEDVVVKDRITSAENIMDWTLAHAGSQYHHHLMLST